MFTADDMRLADIAAATLAKVVSERRALGQYIPPEIDGKVGAVCLLSQRMHEVNCRLESLAEELRVARTQHALDTDRAVARGRRDRGHITALRETIDRLTGQLLATQDAKPYDPEPDAMLDWIEAQPWGDVRLALAPQERADNGSLRDAIRYAMRRTV